MLPIISTMSMPASMTLETAPVVIWAMLALLVVASLGVLRSAWAAKKRARIEVAEQELLERLARRVSAATHETRRRPLAA